MVSHSVWSSPVRLGGWPASQGSSCLRLPSSGITGIHWFMCVLRIKLRPSCLCGKHFTDWAISSASSSGILYVLWKTSIQLLWPFFKLFIFCSLLWIPWETHAFWILYSYQICDLKAFLPFCLFASVLWRTNVFNSGEVRPVNVFFSSVAHCFVSYLRNHWLIQSLKIYVYTFF